MELRPITQRDDPAMAKIIRQVMTEHGASGAGFAIHDAEVDAMCAAYARPGHCYSVVVHEGSVLGGAGIAPLTGADRGICELRKMYFLPEARGHGWGLALLTDCLKKARALGYHTCYLETLTGMDAAQRLYRRAGFEPIAGALGSTGHFSCDKFYAKPL